MFHANSATAAATA